MKSLRVYIVDTWYCGRAFPQKVKPDIASSPLRQISVRSLHVFRILQIVFIFGRMAMVGRISPLVINVTLKFSGDKKGGLI